MARILDMRKEQLSNALSSPSNTSRRCAYMLYAELIPALIVTKVRSRRGPELQ